MKIVLEKTGYAGGCCGLGEIDIWDRTVMC